MLRLPNDVVSDEIDAWKVEVPWPSFITQDVSPRRDVNYPFRFTPKDSFRDFCLPLVGIHDQF
jgi:hypothetical protein